MAQNRKPPAYQEYAATMLADKNFRLMSLEERGLLYTMRLECWQNKEVPATGNQLAKYLGCELSIIQNALTQRVKSFFMQTDDGLYSQELEDYRSHLVERKIKQSEGGKRGAVITNNKQRKPKPQSKVGGTGMATGNPQVSRRGHSGSLVKPSSEQQSQTQSLESDVIQDEWVSSYEHASNGE